MATITPVNVWSSANDWTGDPLRDWLIKVNTNIDNLNTDKVETSDFTDANIKVKYENNADTNAYTDAEKTAVSTISGKSDRAWDTYTGNHNFSGAELEIPNWTAPVVNADWEIAIDTSVSWLSHGIIRYYATEEVFNLPLPVAQLAALNNGFIPKFNASTQEFELVAETTGWGDTITTTVNTIKKDSTAWTSDTYGVLTGAVNSINTTYTTSTSIYVSWTLTVYRNGVRQVQGISEDWVETTPWSGIFDFNTAPLTWDVIDVEYSNQDVTASALIAEKDVTSVSTNYTVLSTDRVVLVNAASWDLTITLPTPINVDTVWVTIKKIDTSWNIVTIATPWSETIDNETTIDILSPFESITTITDGSNYFIK